jgi:hypothetical protein
MVDTFPRGIASQFSGGIFQVTSQHIGQILVEGICKQFPRQKTQRGDSYVDLTYDILDTNLSLIKPDDKHTIQRMIAESVLEFQHLNLILTQCDSVMEKRKALDMEGDTRLERFLKARQFKELSKALYIVTKVRFEIIRHDVRDAQL